MLVKLPEQGRPLNVFYRKCALGVDLPAQLFYDLRGLDGNFYFIYHPYRILWDNIVNEYTGKLDEERYPVVENSFKYGQLVMGHVLSNGQGIPAPEGNWHLWRYCSAINSWAHIIEIKYKDPIYMKLIVERIWLQAKYNDRYGHRSYQKMMEEADLKQRAKIQDEKQDLMNQINKANTALVGRAMYNFEHGRVKPTKPKKDIIVSGAGINKRSRITRDLTDREGGLILPDNLGD